MAVFGIKCPEIYKWLAGNWCRCLLSFAKYVGVIHYDNTVLVFDGNLQLITSSLFLYMLG
jgi:hypothetical protein